MRGRKPETAEEQAAKGAPGKRMSQKVATAVRASTKITPLQVGNVRPPRWLKRSRKATEIWNDVLPQLLQLNMATQLDSLSLGRYCRYVAEWIAADLTVQKEGTWYTATGTNGEQLKKRHPAWQACQDIEKMLRETEAAFGMRPDTRYRILRDQAASRGLGGLGGLFGDDDGDERHQQAAASSAPAAQNVDEDALGILGNFDSVPPAKMN